MFDALVSRVPLVVLILSVLVSGSMPARAEDSIPGNLTTEIMALDRLPAEGDTEIMVVVGNAVSAHVVIEVASDAQPGYIRVFVFEQLAADCVVGEQVGLTICTTVEIPLWEGRYPEPGPDRGMPVRIESDASYTLTVYTTDLIPETHLVFLPSVFR